MPFLPKFQRTNSFVDLLHQHDVTLHNVTMFLVVGTRGMGWDEHDSNVSLVQRQ
jgi:hypothetical protein